MMNKECNLITSENIQGEIINNEIEQINLRVQAFKEQKHNELLKQNNDLRQRISKAIEYIGNKNIGVPRKTREKAIKILRGVDDE